MTLPVTPIAPKHRQADDTTALPWWKAQPLSILELADALEVAGCGRAAFDPVRVVKRLRAMNATAAHVFPLGCHLDGATMFFRHESPGDPPPAFDYIAEWLEHSIPAGLRTIVYFNVHSVKARFAIQHPEWQCRRFDGSLKDDVYNIESTFCVNSPWREWVFARLRELCSYAIDGVFFDGPVFFDDCCFCEHCRALYGGGEMCSMQAISDPSYPELIEFRAQSIARFVRESRDVIKSIRRELLFYVNANPLQPSRLTARDNRKLAPCQDVLASEGGFLGGNLMTERPIWQVGLNAKLLETQASAAGVPHLVFDSLTHTPWTYYTLPAAEAKLLWASSVAHGAVTWMSAYRELMDRPAASAVGELYHFASRHRAALFNTESLANIALVVSAPTLNYYACSDVARTDFTTPSNSDRPGNVTRELYGWYHALWTAHCPFDVIDEVSLRSGDLRRYRLIVLPNTACLSDADADAIRHFVESGGFLIASFETALYDEHGRRRKRSCLAEVLGIQTDARQPALEGPLRWDYLFDSSATSPRMPSPHYALPITPTAEARTLFTFSKPLADRYAGFPEDSGRVAVMEHAYGTGTAIFFACDMGAAIWEWRLPEHLAIVHQLILRANPLMKLLDAPPSIDVSLRRSRGKGGERFVHLVSFNGGMARPMQRVLPLYDLTARLRGRFSDVRTLRHAATVALQLDGQDTLVRLPILHEYEILQLHDDVR